MGVSSIKYKLITHEDLKASSNIFWTILNRKQAKMSANSFIGNLGTKYKKINHRFTCRDYETAMNIWTSGINKGMNISIDNYNDLYLIKEQKIERWLSETCSVNRFVVSEVILYVLNLIEY